MLNIPTNLQQLSELSSQKGPKYVFHKLFLSLYSCTSQGKRHSPLIYLQINWLITQQQQQHPVGGLNNASQLQVASLLACQWSTGHQTPALSPPTRSTCIINKLASSLCVCVMQSSSMQWLCLHHQRSCTATTLFFLQKCYWYTCRGGDRA